MDRQSAVADARYQPRSLQFLYISCMQSENPITAHTSASEIRGGGSTYYTQHWLALSTRIPNDSRSTVSPLNPCSGRVQTGHVGRIWSGVESTLHCSPAVCSLKRFTARRSYASAVLGVVILSVCPSVCHTRAL